ncbi:MAG TPA: hypothetical protein VFQ74_07755 [Pseudolysinimonas sp.]|nr:hypothetical protein [Pseudolysinimonas sp.]
MSTAEAIAEATRALASAAREPAAAFGDEQFHHHLLHAGEFRMRMIRGRPHLLSPPWIDAAQRWRHVTKSRLGVAA